MDFWVRRTGATDLLLPINFGNQKFRKKVELKEGLLPIFELEEDIEVPSQLDDLDGDGDLDLLIGNTGLNSQFKVSEKEPFQRHLFIVFRQTILVFCHKCLETFPLLFFGKP